MKDNKFNQIKNKINDFIQKYETVNGELIKYSDEFHEGKYYMLKQLRQIIKEIEKSKR